MKKALAFLIIVLSAFYSSSQAQQADSLLIKNNKLILDSLNAFFDKNDSLSIFNMMETLLNADSIKEVKEKSQMAIRLGYNSNIIADNSTFNIRQFGLAPGVSYYHTSGAYADFTTYWSQEYHPNFYLSIASAGYLHVVNKWYSIIAEYSHYLYSDNNSGIYVPYTENIGITNYIEFKPFIIRLDYYLYFGQKTAHRIMPSIGATFVKKKWLGFNRISIYPNLNVLYGTEEVVKTNLYPNTLQRFMYNRNHPNDPQLPYTYDETKNEFGVMNYSFSMPITFTKKDWTFLVSYNYNLPQSLTNEDTNLQNGGYLSFSITRYIGF